MDFRGMSPPSLLDWELSKLRECTKEALRMSWAEAERLQDENIEFENRIAELRHKIEKIEDGDFETLLKKGNLEFSQKENDILNTYSFYAKFFHSDPTNLDEELLSRNYEQLSKENDCKKSEPGDINEERTESELMDRLAQLERSTKMETQDLEKQIAERERVIVALEETARRQEETVHKLRKEIERKSSLTEQESKGKGEDLDILTAYIKDLEMKDRKQDMLLLKLTHDLRKQCDV